MMIRAYDEDYLAGAQDILGHAFDFAINTLNYKLDEFVMYFRLSRVSNMFEIGNPTYIAGMTGCELVRETLMNCGLENPEQKDEMYLDRSPEFWTGWALAYYQWYTGTTFARILDLVPIEEIYNMYSVYHEMDIVQFVDEMNRRIKERLSETRLRKYRTNIGMTQSELATESGVSIRQIQLFEQKQRDINKSEAGTLMKLSKVLKVGMEDLMEVW